MATRLAFGLLLAVLGSSAAGQPLPTDAGFVKDASSGNLAAAMLGALASRRGTSPDIKAIGQRVVKDRGEAQSRLVPIAKRKEVPLSRKPKPEAEALYRRLSKLKGAAFDRAYRIARIESLRKDVASYTDESRRGKDPEVRIFASKTLPTSKAHLQSLLALRV